MLLCMLLEPLPVGTNLGLLHLLWMLASGRLLESRGAVIPGLSACGLPARAVRRAWAALGWGDWAIGPRLGRWMAVAAAGLPDPLLPRPGGSGSPAIPVGIVAGVVGSC